MKIQVYEWKKAPEWVQIWNGVNAFILGYTVPNMWDKDFAGREVFWAFFYFCIYLLTIGQFFMPKKSVEFPGDFIRFIKEKWSIITG